MKSQKPSNKALADLDKQIREHSLSYPETTEEFPWGHSAAKVRGKMFAVWATESGNLTLSVKLPQSKESALMLPFAEPTGYGMGKSGWVTLTFSGKEKLPIGIIKDWIDESYRTIAPKKLSKSLPPRK